MMVKKALGYVAYLIVGTIGLCGALAGITMFCVFFGIL